MMASDSRPKLGDASCLVGAGGAPIEGAGKAQFGLRLGPLDVKADAIVADIEDDALLGCDVLCGDKLGPADILLSKNEVFLGGKMIPVFQVRKEKRTRRVTVANDTSIPGLSEAVVSVFVESFEDDDGVKADYVIEPADGFAERYPLKMANTLVNINRYPTCKVRVMNPFEIQVDLKQQTEIGKAEVIERVVSVITETEDSTNENNYESLRRIQIGNKQQNIKIESLVETNTEDIPEHLRDLFETSTQGKSLKEKQVVASLLKRYESSFSKDEWDIGLTHLAEHSIDTGDALPIKQRPRRVPIAYADEERKAIEDLMQKGVIQKSTSPWASPIVLVKKKCGAIRPCVDYRKINALVRPDGFPLPRVQDCIDAVGGSKLFSNFDLTSGYFQIPLKAADRPKSAFCCKFGQFEMTRMPFGLNNSASTFQRTMELALQGLQWITCLIYIDDIIVFGEDFDQHIQRVDEVLDRITKAGLKLKPSKCRLLQTEVVFLGHVVSAEGVRPDPANISKIIEWPRPANPKQVKQFVATGSYYRRFVKNFAQTARPLIELTKKDATFQWSDNCEEAFLELKKALIGPDVMGFPRNEGTFFLDTDASGTGIGSVLSQMQEGRERVIAYASRACSKAERNYCITEQELLALVYFIQYFRQYLLGRRFTVRTDHQALVWLFKLREPSGKVARWIEILAPFDFEIEYRPGKKQGHCDALSRCTSPRDCSCSEVDMSEPLRCGPCGKCRRRAELMSFQLAHEPGDVRESPEETKDEYVGMIRATAKEQTLPQWMESEDNQSIAKKQSEDVNIGRIHQAKIEERKPSCDDMSTESPESRHYWILWDNLFLENGILCKRFEKANGSGKHTQVIIPKCMRSSVMHLMHDNVLSGHMGVKKTKEKIAQRCYWYRMKEDVKWYVRKCDTCAADKVPARKPKAPIGHLGSGAPWDTLALDYLGPFPKTPRGNKYILVMTDHFTKYVEIVPVPHQQAEDCAMRIVNEIIPRWGTPLNIHSDQGATFESNVFRELCKLLSIKKTRTSPRNPKGNGQTERFNRTLLRMIKAYLADEQDEWDIYLGCIAGAYRATPHESTHLSPNLLAIGREIRMPADLVLGYSIKVNNEVEEYCEYVDEIRDRMTAAHELARKYLKKSAKRSKEVYDVNIVKHNYKAGDLVWCLRERRKVGVTPKLEKKYEGPYVVKQKRSELNFVIQVYKDGTERTLHHDKLKRYEGDNPPKWALKVQKRLQNCQKR